LALPRCWLGKVKIRVVDEIEHLAAERQVVIHPLRRVFGSKNSTEFVVACPTGTAPKPGVRSASVGALTGGKPLRRRNAGVSPLSGETKFPERL